MIPVLKELTCNERYYIPLEITWLLKTLDFHVIGIYRAKQECFLQKRYSGNG
jgi:hypothetical protein